VVNILDRIRNRWSQGTLALALLVGSVAGGGGREINFDTTIKPVLQEHCFKCHGPKKQKGKLRLDTLSTDLVQNQDAAEAWYAVREALTLGEMPPEEETTLSRDERETLLSWLNTTIDRAAKLRGDKGGRVVVRRLNRVEYQNTMRDLFGLDISYAADFPPDGVSPDGMFNNGRSLRMMGIQFEYYLKAARNALDQVILTTPEPEVFTHTFEKSTEGKWVNKIKPSNRLGQKQEFLVRIKKDYPENGAFRIKVKAHAEFPKKRGPLPRMEVFVGYRPDTLVDRELLAELDITADGMREYEFVGRIENFPLPVRGQGKYPGLVISVVNTNHDGSPPLVVESLEFQGPLFDRWPPAQHRRILHDSDLRHSHEADYALEVIERFLPRAWRRPVMDSEVERFIDFFKTQRRESPTFEEAIKETLAMALISPSFLYLLEPDSDDPRRLNSFELASRLSYFLWSTMPDEVLMTSVRSGVLQEPAELAKQVSRMIGDDRSRQFVEQFTAQWLDLDAIDRLVIDKKLYPDFRPDLSHDMRSETEELFAHILRNDLSARHFITSDFVMLNNRLARHYGIEGIYGGEFRPVALSGDHASRRGGLLSQASILMANSTGRNSNPIKRAVFLRKRLLNDPPAPPPPNVPELKTADPDFARLPIREQLKAHVNDSACADCHRGIDPWGLALEEFDAVGKWREKIVWPVGGGKTIELPVDAKATLPDGREVDGIAQLREYLWEHRREKFARALVSKLLVYSLGRSLEFSDEAAISALTDEFVKNEMRVGQLLQAIVATPMFQSK
tara:strand:+ start:90 stop:2456 length:2367 start_codon:yes stop_codon:yes gene_type:complete